MKKKSNTFFKNERRIVTGRSERRELFLYFDFYYLLPESALFVLFKNVFAESG